MKIRYSIFFIALIGLMFTACKTHQKSTKSTHIQGPTVIQKPVIADLDVKETKVSGTATAKGSNSVYNVKQMAIADALSKSNADVLVEPQFEISTSWNKITVNVTGYPATYKNFRPMEAADTIFVNTDNLVSSSGQGIVIRGNKKLKKVILYTVGGVAGATAIGFLIFMLTWY